MPTGEDFTNEMHLIYEAARRECGVNSTRFLRMLKSHKGVETAKRLINARELSEGFISLKENGRLDLTVEYLVLQPPWDQLFNEETLRKARERLKQFDFDI
jgi:hypothetical protein